MLLTFHYYFRYLTNEFQYFLLYITCVHSSILSLSLFMQTIASSFSISDYLTSDTKRHEKYLLKQLGIRNSNFVCYVERDEMSLLLPWFLITRDYRWIKRYATRNFVGIFLSWNNLRNSLHVRKSTKGIAFYRLIDYVS